MAQDEYRQVMGESKESDKGIAGYQWTLRLVKVVSMEQFWDWAKLDAIDGAGYLFTGPECCAYFEKKL